MKYRRLSLEELTELERDFVLFLAANSVTGEEWEQLKTERPGKAEELIDIFSDMVFEQVLKKVEYLEFKTPNDVKTFYCTDEKIVMNGLFIEGRTDLDLTQPADADQMLAMVRAAGARVKLYTAEKSYQGEREAELFRMLENGALISKDGLLFKTLESLKKIEN